MTEEQVAADFSGIIGQSPCMQEIFELLSLVAPSDANILLLGETGTGKEIVAHVIHNNSRRRQGPFVVVNCAALPETLLESELFGHERGAFTGAIARKEGRFYLAHQGTLFLDEIGELSLTTQAKILRVLQSREFEPLGSNRTHKVDVRIIAATNRQLEAEVRQGRFREDLYYRLNVVSIALPPLRERGGDIDLLAQYFLEYYNKKNARQVRSIHPEVLRVFRQYSWPGNVRELENVIERGVILCMEGTLTLKALPPALRELKSPPPAEYEATARDSEPSLVELERELILRTLDKVAGDRQQAALILGISIEELNLKLKAYGG
ncbi:MAG: sigma-54 interaction domain-containing protein [Desulfobacteraceae bacterium]